MDSPKLEELYVTMEENFNVTVKNGKFFFFILLATLPGLCYSAIIFEVVKIAASQLVGCDIPAFQNSSWTKEQIKSISELKVNITSCHIKKLNYGEIAKMSFEKALNYVKNSKAESQICPKFVFLKPYNYPSYLDEFRAYCYNGENQIFYELGNYVPFTISCLFIVPLADLYGRKRIIQFGIGLMFVAVFIKILSFNQIKEVIGDALINLAYPALKFPAEITIFELANDDLRPLAFILTHLGTFLPHLFFGIVTTLYWKYLKLIGCSTVLFLPLLSWYFPESPLWYISKRRWVQGAKAMATLNDSPQHNEQLTRWRNGKLAKDEFRGHFKEMGKINKVEFFLLNILFIVIGFVVYHSNAKYDIPYFTKQWMRYVNGICGIFSIMLTIPHMYFCGFRLATGMLFLIDAVLYIIVAEISFDDMDISIIIIFAIDLVSVSSHILTCYLALMTFPTSHRCTYFGICRFTLYSGLVVLKVIHLGSVRIGQLSTAAVSLFASFLAFRLLFRWRKITNGPGNFPIYFEDMTYGKRKFLRLC